MKYVQTSTHLKNPNIVDGDQFIQFCDGECAPVHTRISLMVVYFQRCKKQTANDAIV